MLMLSILFALNGCSLGGETIPKNRTKEQYEFEKTFEPMIRESLKIANHTVLFLNQKGNE